MIGFSYTVCARGHRMLLEFECDEGLWVAVVDDDEYVDERLGDAIAAATGEDKQAAWIIALEDQVLAELGMRERPRYPWW